MPVLIRNTYVIPGARRTHQDATDILIEGDRIAAIGRGLEAPGAEVIDGSRRLALPGFVNAHTHSNESFEQGFWDALPLEVWLLWKYPPFAVPKLPERAHYLRTMLLAIECIRSGVTCVQDDLINRVADPDAFAGSAAAYRDLGLRAAITVSMGDVPPLGSLLWTEELMDPAARARLAGVTPPDWREHLDTFRAQSARWHGAGDGRIRVILGPIGPQWCTDTLLEAVTDLSLSRSVPVHTHTLESKMQAVQAAHLYGGATMVEHLDRLGVLTPHFTLNHAVWLTDGDIALLAERGCSVTHNPLSNLKLGSGIARIPDLLKAGVNVGLGTDGTSTSDRADMFRSLGMAAILHRVADLDYETWLDAEDALAMATTGSARTAGLEGEVGLLEPGRKADIILIDRDDYGLIPLKKPVSQLAYAVNSEAVQTVLVDGRVVMRDRVLTQVDEASLKAEIREEAERYLRDHSAEKEAAGKVYEHYFRAAHLRAAGYEVPASVAPVRLPCGCYGAGIPHTHLKM